MGRPVVSILAKNYSRAQRYSAGEEGAASKPGPQRAERIPVCMRKNGAVSNVCVVGPLEVVRLNSFVFIAASVCRMILECHPSNKQ